MQITTFNPMILSPKAEEVIALFEELGFERRHQKDNIDDKDISSVRMKDSNGFHVDVARVESLPKDMTTMRMNVRDFEEAYELLKAHGFKNAKGEDTVNSSCEILPDDLPVRVCNPAHTAYQEGRQMKITSFDPYILVKDASLPGRGHLKNRD